MPELPEVEFCARRLREWLPLRLITAVTCLPGKPLRDQDPEAFIEGLTGRRVVKIDRHGKQLLLDLDDRQTWLVHLGMTGKFRRVATVASPTPLAGERLRLRLEDGSDVVFCDSRRFGRVRLLAHDVARAHPEVAGLGLDALLAVADPPAFVERFRGVRRPIKIALLDQHLIAGIGNIYACDGLFGARVDPFLAADALSDRKLVDLAAAVGVAMQASLDREKSEEITYLQEEDASNPFVVYGREGEPCPRCGGAIARTPQGGRSTFWCPRCQGSRRRLRRPRPAPPKKPSGRRPGPAASS